MLFECNTSNIDSPYKEIVEHDSRLDKVWVNKDISHSYITISVFIHTHMYIYIYILLGWKIMKITSMPQSTLVCRIKLIYIYLFI